MIHLMHLSLITFTTIQDHPHALLLASLLLKVFTKKSKTLLSIDTPKRKGLERKLKRAFLVKSTKVKKNKRKQQESETSESSEMPESPQPQSSPNDSM